MMQHFYKFLCRATLLCLAIAGYEPGYAQSLIQWDRVFGGSNREAIGIVVPALDSGYILGATSASPLSGDKTAATRGSNDYWVLRLNDSGRIVWQKTIGGSGGDVLSDMLVTADGGYIAAGYSASGISGEKTLATQGASDYWILKLDDTGRIEWQKDYGGSAEDRLIDIAATPDGGYIAAGYSASAISGDRTVDTRGAMDAWVLKLNGTGDIQWQKAYGTSVADTVEVILPTPDGGYILGAYRASVTAPPNQATGDATDTTFGGTDYWILKLDDTGRIEWQRTLGGDGREILKDIVITPDSGYIVGGHSNSDATGEKTDISRGGFDYWILKLDKAGNVVWQQTVGGDGNDEMNTLVLTPDGGCIAGGTSTSNANGDKTEAQIGLSDFWMVRLTADGRLVWQKTIGSNINERLLTVLPTSDKGYILGGEYTPALGTPQPDGDRSEGGRGNTDCWIVKLGNPCGDTALLTEVTEEFCARDGYTLPGGAVVYAGGVYNDTLFSPGGCDSIVITTLTVLTVDTSVTRNGDTLQANASGASYQWIDCSDGSPIAGATAATFIAPDPGSYKVAVVEGNCADTSSCFTIEEDPGPDPDKVALVNGGTAPRIYPNPTRGMLYITVPAGNALRQLEITSMTGQKVISQQLSVIGTVQVDLAALSAGLYVVRLRTDLGVVTEKLEVVNANNQ
jgi:hypothetical protein